MKKIMVVFGTRPEAIKVCPVIKKIKQSKQLSCCVCVTGQHRRMIDQVLDVFNVSVDYDLNIMRAKQSLFDITSRCLSELEPIMEVEKPDMVLVHGDTTTALSAAMAAFYKMIPVGHIEAGLRTHNIYSPYPEEFNRQAIGLIAKYNFAPTEQAKKNLIREGKSEESIYVTGNTVIDALQTTVMDNYTNEILEWAKGYRLLVLTAHRRENWGAKMEGMFHAINRIVNVYDDVKVVYPVHLNPVVRNAAKEAFISNERVMITEPMNAIDFHNTIARSYLILTDSGGIQEEAPSLGKPVVVLRDTTERPEGILAGTLKLAGTEECEIYKCIKELLDNKELYDAMSQAKNPYGDGHASEKICSVLEGEQ